MDNRILVFVGEEFDRGKTWWISAIFVALVVIGITVYGPYFLTGVAQDFQFFSFTNIANIVIVVGLTVGYLGWVYIHKPEIVQCVITDEGIEIGNRLLDYKNLSGFYLEMEKDGGEYKNIVFVYEGKPEIFTIAGGVDLEDFEDFLASLEAEIPQIKDYEPSVFQSALRKLKL